MISLFNRLHFWRIFYQKWYNLMLSLNKTRIQVRNQISKLEDKESVTKHGRGETSRDSREGKNGQETDKKETIADLSSV